jgi:hypothetical protein
MGKPKPGKSDKGLGKSFSPDPAVGPSGWKGRAWDAAVRLTGALERSRDHGESIRVLLDILSEDLGITCHAAYLDEAGNGDLRLVRGHGVGDAPFPRSLPAGSAFVRWLGRSGSPEIIESFFRSAGDLTESELDVQDALAEAGAGSACAFRFGGEVIGIYVFASGLGEGFPIEEARTAVGLMTGITSSVVAGQLISAETGKSGEYRERTRVSEFRAVRSAVLKRTATDLETSLGVLMSGLWSMDPDSGGDPVMVEMARDAAVSLGARVAELISLSRIEPTVPDDELVQVDMADVVEDVTREMIADFERKGLVVSIEDQAGGRILRSDPGKLAYVVRSALDHVTHTAGRGSAVDIAWSVKDEGPDGDEGTWFKLRVSGSGSCEEDAIDSMLDSLAAEHGEAVGPMSDSGLTLSEYILGSFGGRLTRSGGYSGDISIWLPIGY